MTTYKKLEDNGPKWGSNVKQNSDGTFPYDSKMHKDDPKKWNSMMAERMVWAHHPESPEKRYTRNAPQNYRNRTKY